LQTKHFLKVSGGQIFLGGSGMDAVPVHWISNLRGISGQAAAISVPAPGPASGVD